jgi:Region in Clathrin and VPS
MDEPVFSIAEFPEAGEHRQSSRHVTCAATSAKLVLLGYTDGAVALFDVFGNMLDEQRDRHAASVVAVALGAGSTSDDVAASASADGTLRANNLFNPYATANSAMLSSRTGLRTRIPKGISAIAVDPDYGKPRSGERIAYADNTGRVVLFTSGWFGGSEVLITREDLFVQSMVWTGLLLGWSSEKGVQIYDTRLQRMVCFVEAPQVIAVSSHIDVPREKSAGERGNVVDSAQSLSVAVSDRSKLSDEEQRLQRQVVFQSGNHVPSVHETDSNINSDASTVYGEIVPLALSFMSTHHWKTRIMLRAEVDEDEVPTAYGERTLTMYIAWPSLSKVVVIGPHKESQGMDLAGIDSVAMKAPPRHVETTLTISRTDIPVPLPEESNSFLLSPILSIAPFGKDVAVLTGTSDHRLVLARVKKDAMDDMHCMHLNQSQVNAAELFPVPGGEPLLLVVAICCKEESKETENSNEYAVLDDEQTQNAIDNGSQRVEADGQDKCNHSSIAKIPEERYSSVCFARALGVAERIKWLLDQGRFEDALKTAEIAPGGSLRRAELSIADVGHQFLESIRANGEYKRLAEVLPRTIISTSPTVAVRGRDKVMRFRRERWEQWISIFRNAGHLEIIAPLIPCHEPRMSDVQYNDVLIELAEANATAMLKVLKSWPSDVYDVPAITRTVETQLVSLLEAENAAGLLPSTTTTKDISLQREALREALFMLYGLSGRHDETLNLLLQEGSSRVFGYVKSHDLYEAVRSTEAMSGLFKIDKDEAADLLVNAPGTLLPPEAVVPILKSMGDGEWLCLYLSGIFRQDPERASQYHNLLVQLLVDYGRPGALYAFLKTSTHFSLDAALTLMGGRTGTNEGLFGRERVHVLATMGDLNAAMDILLKELQDVHGAIDFASEHEDVALWDRLIEHARGHAATLAALLDSPAGGRVNPVRLIPLISSEMDIHGLRERLHRILVDAALERALREDTAAALHYDANRYMAELDEAILRPL